MNTLTLTPEELSHIINNNQHIGNGSYGLVVQLNDDFLLKFNYKIFIDAFNIQNQSIDLHSLGDITQLIENEKEINQIIYGNTESSQLKMIKLAMTKQKFLKHTTLTQGLIIVNDFCVGYILKNHQNMTNLYQYQFSHHIQPEEKDRIINSIGKSVYELLENNIYLNDLTTHNILYNPESRQVELIDFEDSLLCLADKNQSYEQKVLYQFDQIKQSLNQEQTPEKI